MNDCVQFLRNISDLKHTFGACLPERKREMTHEDFLLKHGREMFPDGGLPNGFKFKQMKHCFRNASLLVIEHNPKFIYCEGYAMAKACPIPVHHAWTVTPEGEVIDPTWRDFDKAVYFGIAFEFEFLRQMLLKQEYYGLLNDWQKRYPIESGKFKPSKFLSKAIYTKGGE
jgi:hypothetical protein